MADEGATFCPGCGRPSTECAGCLWEYDPPHFCTTCGTRMAVNVSPGGWRARCKVHGEASSGSRSSVGPSGPDEAAQP